MPISFSRLLLRVNYLSTLERKLENKDLKQQIARIDSERRSKRMVLLSP